MDLRKIKKIEHPKIMEWAKEHYLLENGILASVAIMSDDDLQALKHAASSLTSTNCWYAEYDVKEMVEHAVAQEEGIRNRGRELQQFAAVERPKESK